MGLFSKADDEQPMTATVPIQPLTTHLKIDEADFTCLVRGGVLHVGNLRIALEDIGFHRMFHALGKAADGHDTYKDHIKDIR